MKNKLHILTQHLILLKMMKENFLFKQSNIKFQLSLFTFLLVQLIAKDTKGVYCIPSNPNCGTGSYINSVSIGGTSFSNLNTACNSLNAAAYTIYAPTGSNTTTLQSGTTYTISVTSFGASIISLWIDFNQNQIFESSEWTQVATASVSNVPVSASFVVPVNAVQGATGMRIRSRISSSPNGAIDACTQFGSGEAEDYTITIGNPSPCTLPPAGGTTTASANTICPNTAFTLSLLGASTGTGLSYQWQSSTNNSNWTNLSLANSSTLTTVQLAGTFYRCAVICSGQTSYSTSLYVALNSPINCYCNSGATYTSLSDIGRVVLGSMTNGTAFPVTLNTTAVNTYTNFSAIAPTSLDLGAIYPMSVHQVTSGTINNNATVVVYIDYNQDGVFSYPAESNYLGTSTNASGGNVINGTITIPSTAATGLTGMRVILVENGNLNEPSCGSYFFGETEDYLVNLLTPQACTTPPLAGMAATSTSSVCGNAPFTLSLLGSTSNSNVSYQWQYSSNNFSWIPFASAGNSSIVTTSQNSSSYYRCEVTCSGISSYSTSIYVSFTPLSQCYCNSNATNAAFSDIGNVSIGSLSNGFALPVLNNTLATNSYTNFTAIPPPTLYRGTQYSISVSQILSSSLFYTAYAIVYIDFNQDGTFSTLETFGIGTTTSISGGNTVYSTVSIPSTASLGNTRMRVILVESGGVGQMPCGTYGYGETEDYIVNIDIATPCITPPVAGISTANDSIVCSADQVMLNLSGNSSGSGQTYTWQSSMNNSVWTALSGANSYATYYTNQTQAMYYRCQLNCNGFISYSSPVYVGQNPLSSCYCNSAATNMTDSDIGNITFGSLSNGVATPVFYNSGANKTYSNFTALQAPDLEQGGAYLLSISQISSGGSFYNSHGMAFIDFNQDGLFGFGESFAIGQTSSTNATFTISNYITIPVFASIGATRMRIVLSENTAQTACSIYSYGETEDYTVNIIPSQACPVPVLGGIAVANVTSVCIGQVVQLSLNGNSIIPSGTYNWQYSFDGISFSFLPGGVFPTVNNYQSQSTYYRCYIACGGNTAYSSAVYVPMTPSNQCYCNSTALVASLTDIGNVSIGTLNNGVASPATNNSNATNTYSNFTGLPAPTLELGTVLPITVTQISLSGFTSSFIAAFIDFNQNGVFDTLTESFPLGLTTATLGGNIKTAYIAIPSNAVLGLTRMRIVLKSNGSQSLTPCGTYTSGETEDYTVNIIPALPCSTAPLAGNAIANDTTLCLNDLFYLSLQNNSSLASQTYQWQLSSDNLSWNPIGGAIYPTFNGAFTGNLYYRCVISCSGFIVFSTPVHLSQNPANQCYCISTATNTGDDDIGNVTFIALNNGVAIPATNNPTSVNLYSDFTSLPAQAVIIGASYPISVTQINNQNFFTCQLAVYIDFNQNGIFEPGVETINLGTTTNTLGGNTLTGTINIPFTAQSGLTRMRIVLEEGSSAVPSPCGTYTWGETEDYSLLILQNQSCTNPPTAGFANSTAALVCTNSPFTLYLSGNSSALGQYYQWQSSSDGISWTNIGSISLDSSLVYSQNATSYYQCAITCSGLTSYSVPVLVNMLQSPICGYCTNVGGTSCPSNTKITQVSIAGTTLNNSDTLCYSINGSAVGVFPFGGNTTANILRGNSYNISVTSTQNVSKSVWIDYDQNGSFSANEWTQICTSSVSGIPDIASVSIPFGIPAGPTGMRVRTRINGSPNGATDACSFFGSGETEDYTILIDIGNAVPSVSKSQEVLLYPNPTTDFVLLKIPTQLTDVNKLFLLNALGEIVLEAEIDAQETLLNLKHIPKGIYMVKYQSETIHLHTKLVKE